MTYIKELAQTTVESELVYVALNGFSEELNERIERLQNLFYVYCGFFPYFSKKECDVNKIVFSFIRTEYNDVGFEMDHCHFDVSLERGENGDWEVYVTSQDYEEYYNYLYVEAEEVDFPEDMFIPLDFEYVEDDIATSILFALEVDIPDTVFGKE